MPPRNDFQTCFAVFAREDNRHNDLLWPKRFITRSNLGFTREQIDWPTEILMMMIKALMIMILRNIRN